jgi:solute carrier family 34 (sodium-dependent phosphate cotransporter)
MIPGRGSASGQLLRTYRRRRPGAAGQLGVVAARPSVQLCGGGDRVRPAGPPDRCTSCRYVLAPDGADIAPLRLGERVHPRHHRFASRGVPTAGPAPLTALGPLFTIVIGALLILVVVRYLGKLLKLLMVGKAREVLTTAVGRRPYVAMAAGTGATIFTQSSTITQAVLVPFAGAGILTPRQIYPVTIGANLGTTFTALFAAFAVEGPDAKIGLQAAFVHLVYNVFSIIAIFVIPILRPVPLWCAEHLASIAVSHKWVIVTYLIAVFIVAPALVIVLVAVV